MVGISDDIYTIIAQKILENIRELGEVALNPSDYAEQTIENRLGRAMCNISWARLMYDKGVVFTDLMPKMADLTSFIYDFIKDKKFEDAQTLIRSTILYRIVKAPTYFVNFPKDAIPVLEKFIEEINFMR